MGIMKKIFGGKSTVKKTKDETTIYTYDKATPPESREIPASKYVEEIAEHFREIFPNKKSTVFHEIVSDIIHVDIHIMEPDEDDQYWVLFSTGMSDLPMTLPAEVPADEVPLYQYAEVMMLLPADWKLDEDSLKDENYYWPIRLMKTMARFPHQYRTWLGYGHTVPNTAKYKPYAPNTGLNSVIFDQLKKEISIFQAADGTQINIYLLLPLYKQETKYKLKHGMDALLEKLEVLGDDMTFLNPQRINTCK